MAYTIYKTNGVAITISDNTFNDDYSIRLVGKNRTGYGEAIDQNFVRLLENFSNGTAPSNPTSGQLWWDSSNNTMKVWNGAWKTISGIQVSNSAPDVPATGNFWYNAVTQELKFYNGTLWQTLAGNEITAINITATGNIAAQDFFASSHITANGNIMAGNINNVSGILSVTGNANVGNIGATNGVLTGTLSVTGNANTGNIGATNAVITANGTFGNINSVSGILNVTGNATVGNIGATNGVLTGTLAVTGNATAGNLATAGQVTATGNITGGWAIPGDRRQATLSLFYNF